MPERQRVLTPLTQLKKPEGLIQFDCPLPRWINPDGLGLDESRVHRLMNIAHLSQIKITGSGKRPVSDDRPLTRAVGAKLVIYPNLRGPKVPIADSSLDRDKSAEYFHGFTKIPMSVDLNLSEIGQRVSSDERCDSRAKSPQAWAHHIDQSLRDSIRIQGSKHLLLGFVLDPNNTLFTLAVDYFQLVNLSGSEAKTALLAFIGINTFAHNGWGLLTYTMIAAMKKKEKHNISLGDWSSSLFVGPQLDRALVLNLLTASQTLVEPINR